MWNSIKACLLAGVALAVAPGCSRHSESQPTRPQSGMVTVVESVSGRVSLADRHGGTRVLHRGDRVESGERVFTNAGSSVRLRHTGDVRTEVEASSVLLLGAASPHTALTIRSIRGRVRIRASHDRLSIAIEGARLDLAPGAVVDLTTTPEGTLEAKVIEGSIAGCNGSAGCLSGQVRVLRSRPVSDRAPVYDDMQVEWDIPHAELERHRDLDALGVEYAPTTTSSTRQGLVFLGMTSNTVILDAQAPARVAIGCPFSVRCSIHLFIEGASRGIGYWSHGDPIVAALPPGTHRFHVHDGNNHMSPIRQIGTVTVARSRDDLLQRAAVTYSARTVSAIARTRLNSPADGSFLLDQRHSFTVRGRSAPGAVVRINESDSFVTTGRSGAFSQLRQVTSNERFVVTVGLPHAEVVFAFVRHARPAPE